MNVKKLTGLEAISYPRSYLARRRIGLSEWEKNLDNRLNFQLYSYGLILKQHEYSPIELEKSPDSKSCHNLFSITKASANLAPLRFMEVMFSMLESFEDDLTAAEILRGLRFIEETKRQEYAEKDLI